MKIGITAVPDVITTVEVIFAEVIAYNGIFIMGPTDKAALECHKSEVLALDNTSSHCHEFDLF